MTKVLGRLGAELNLLIRQGGTFGPYPILVKGPDGQPIDLTGCAIRGQIRAKALDETVAASFGITITDAAGGAFTLELGASVTAAMSAGETLASPASQYTYDVELEDTQGRVIPLLYGKAEVLREVTRV